MNVRDLINGTLRSSSTCSSPNSDENSSGPVVARIPGVEGSKLDINHDAPAMLSPGSSVAPSSTVSLSFSQGYFRKASIVLIGMRGVGKTTLATIIAKALGWDVLDADAIFEHQQKTSIVAYIASHGWDAFRQAESDIISDILGTHTTGKVIACGGGVVELEQNRTLLKGFRKQGLVIHVLREKDAVLTYLRESTHFPPFIHETAVEAWDRREVLFRECCSFEFVSLTVPIPPAPGDSKETVTPDQTLALKPVEEDFFRLLRFIHGVDTNKVILAPRGHRSYCLPLTFEDLRQVTPMLEEISLGIDLWELRVDLLASYDPTFLAFQVATLRRHSTLPILFTVRTQNHGGKHPDVPSNDQAAVNALHTLLDHALRLGVEYIDLEVTFPQSVLADIVKRKRNTTIIGSYQDWKGTIAWLGLETRQAYDSIMRMGADIVKIVNKANSFEDNMGLRQFAASVERNVIPLLAFNMGAEGKISRVLNPILTPVFHPLLPKTSVPGLVSFYESQAILYLIGLTPPKKYYVFGNPIAHSMSPTLHNTAFSILGLPHTNQIYETTRIEEVKPILGSAAFGGASVTIPYKMDIIPLLQHVSRHARLIGAVNTIVAMPGNGSIGLSGDNTDWRAIKTCLLRSLTPANIVTSTTAALVIGAGGGARATLYALHQIGVVNIYIYNRTREKAEGLAEEFEKLDPLLRIHVLDTLAVPLPISPPLTIIVSAIPMPGTGSSELIDVGLRPDHLSATGGVAIDLAYGWRMTKLLALAKEKREQGVAWTGVEGIEVLLEQGYEQCKLWTGRRAPRRQVREKVLEVYEEALSTH